MAEKDSFNIPKKPKDIKEPTLQARCIDVF